MTWKLDTIKEYLQLCGYSIRDDATFDEVMNLLTMLMQNEIKISKRRKRKDKYHG